MPRSAVMNEKVAEENKINQNSKEP